MLLAELEIRHSRAVAPTRRVALGPHWLPTEPAPGYGGILLGGIVAAHFGDVDPELRDEFLVLVEDLEDGRRISQPRLRHRFQTDVVGLDRSRHKLIGQAADNLFSDVTFELEGSGRPVPQILGAIYAAARLHEDARPAVFAAIRKAARWEDGPGPRLVALLADVTTMPPTWWRRFSTDERWALEILGFGPDEDQPGRDEVLQRFRSLLRESHPDHGAEHEGAGQRILELTEARRILLP
ncbi:MAG TPA: hypothetical protein VHT97_02290 [Acidimicrobiales bacterium]|jgi:hypothetical protein|nr:hypothetical protein [Acidimicrobiales bacterium]